LYYYSRRNEEKIDWELNHIITAILATPDLDIISYLSSCCFSLVAVVAAITTFHLIAAQESLVSRTYCLLMTILNQHCLH